jgi:type II secretory pathway pseudopilin PulG
MYPSPSHRGRAMTLLEVIVAISLISMLLGAMLTFFWQVIEVRDTVVAQADRMQIARQVLSRMEAELRGCVGFEQFGFPIEQALVEEEYLDVSEGFEGPTEEAAEDYVPLLIGDRRNITFLTSRLPAKHQYDLYREFDDQPPAQHDLTQLSYWLWVDPEETDDEGEPVIGGIIRTEKRTLNQFIVELEDPLDVRNDLWSPELGYLEFRYFDGVEWDIKWDVTEGNSLPQLIQITVGFEPCSSEELENVDLEEYPLEEYPYGDDRVHPDRYSIVVRIPAADKFFGSRIQKVGQQLSETLGGMEGLP